MACSNEDIPEEPFTVAYECYSRYLNPESSTRAVNMLNKLGRKDVLRYLREHHIMHATEGSYQEAVKLAIKVQQRTTCGMLYYVTRGSLAMIARRVYIIWDGEPVELLAEALAHIVMAHADRKPFVILRRILKKETDT